MKYINLNFCSKVPDGYSEVRSKLRVFPCGEIEFSIDEDVSNQEVTIFQSFTVGGFNDDLMKLMAVCDVLKRNNAGKITYFAPFLPYMRQDKINQKKSSIGSILVAKLINNCGIDEVVTYDLHSPLEDYGFKCKLQNLSMIPRFVEDIEKNFDKEEVVVVFPDFGAVSRFSKFFDRFKTATIEKTREESRVEMEISGHVNGKIAIIVDDIIDSGDTMVVAAKILGEQGARSIFAYATHGIFSKGAITKIEHSDIKRVVVSDTLDFASSVKIIRMVDK